MVALFEYSNVDRTAFYFIEKKGFQVWYNEEDNCFLAEKDGWDLCAKTPCSLLGLVTIYENVNPEEFKINWWKNENKDFTLSREKTEYVPVCNKSE